MAERGRQGVCCVFEIRPRHPPERHRISIALLNLVETHREVVNVSARKGDIRGDHPILAAPIPPFLGILETRHLPRLGAFWPKTMGKTAFRA